MRTLVRFAVTMGATALFTGCGGSPLVMAPSTPQSLTLKRLSHAGSWMLSKATSEELVYISVSGGVAVYSTTGQSVGEIKGLFDDSPGLCSDSQGNIWLTYGDSMLEYAHGGTVPIAQAYLPNRFYAISCAVDPTTGHLAVSESSETYGRNIAVFQNIYYPPETYTDSDAFIYTFLTYDDQGNLFVNGTRGQHNVFAELPSGGSTIVDLSLDEKFGKIGGIQWDGQYLALGDSLKHVIYQMTVSDGHGTTVGSTHLHDWRPKFKAIVPFAIQDGMIAMAFAEQTVGYFNYPQGGRATHRISIYSNGGIAISVPPSGSPRRQR
jgi:hypothetical protein